MNVYLMLYSCCKLTRGISQSIICDLQRNKYYIIDNNISRVLDICSKKPITEVRDIFSYENSYSLDLFFDFLIKEELAFYISEDELSAFPRNQNNLETPSLLDNFIIDVDSKSNHNYEKIFNALSDLLLKHLQIRFFTQINKNNIEDIFSSLDKTNIRTIEIVLPFNKGLNLEYYKILSKKYKKLISINIYNSPKYLVDQELQTSIIFITENITSHLDCGKISKDLFCCNYQLYIESVKFNTCLNRKAAIDTSGRIKNCPSMPNNYGYYYNNSIKNIVMTKEFQKYWTLKKDDIDICQICEFRHVCTDCRAFVNGNIYSKPAKCNYNPYILKWEADET